MTGAPACLMSLTCASEEETAALAGMLAACVKAGDLLALSGDLGAGKSTFARALIRAMLADPEAEVPSPTFTLVQNYETGEEMELWHADLYRITEPEEVYELGLDEARTDAICLVEWPDRMPVDWWDGALELVFHIGDKGVRHIEFRGDANLWSDRLAGLMS